VVVSRESFPRLTSKGSPTYSPEWSAWFGEDIDPRKTGGHNITAKFVDRAEASGQRPHPRNNDANSRYFTRCNEEGLAPHPARFPPQLPAFFIRFLTDEGDLVVGVLRGIVHYRRGGGESWSAWILYRPRS